MISFDKNSVGYHETGGRFDYFCLGGFACLVDTTTNLTGDWQSAEEARKEADYLNSGAVFEI